MTRQHDPSTDSLALRLQAEERDTAAPDFPEVPAGAPADDDTAEPPAVIPAPAPPVDEEPGPQPEGAPAGPGPAQEDANNAG